MDGKIAIGLSDGTGEQGGPCAKAGADALKQARPTPGESVSGAVASFAAQ